MPIQAELRIGDDNGSCSDESVNTDQRWTCSEMNYAKDAKENIKNAQMKQKRQKTLPNEGIYKTTASCLHVCICFVLETQVRRFSSLTQQWEEGSLNAGWVPTTCMEKGLAVQVEKTRNRKGGRESMQVSYYIYMHDCILVKWICLILTAW